jgi:uncharacterized protein
MHAPNRSLIALALIAATAAFLAAAPTPPATNPATSPAASAPARGPGRGGRGGARGPQVQQTTPSAADVARTEAALPDAAPATPAKPRKVLAFGKASGFQHGSIPIGTKTVELLGTKTKAFTATISFDAAIFTPEKLAEFDAIVLVSTTGNFLDAQNDPAETTKRRAAFESFIKDGKGVVGIHAASDAYYDWPEYGKMIGGYFSSHKVGREKIFVTLDDPKSPLNAAFEEKSFEIADEIYRFAPLSGQNRKQAYNRTNLHVLLTVDVAKFNNEPAGTDLPISWCQPVGKGRVFYTSLGHNNDIYANTPVLKHYLAGIQYAIGDLKADDSLPK